MVFVTKKLTSSFVRPGIGLVGKRGAIVWSAQGWYGVCKAWVGAGGGDDMGWGLWAMLVAVRKGTGLVGWNK